MENDGVPINHVVDYTLSEACRGVNWADLMAAQGAFGADFYDRSILRRKHRAYYHSGRMENMGFQSIMYRLHTLFAVNIDSKHVVFFSQWYCR